ncbi:hypothetical protein E2C01_101881 [Portunus trituberculatus]|uniref:Uncharacterized protein n=1 Tax=Portunus trituberculatus TaxID=210409 RepID=A0A5B7KGY2_PORTR|nr:hypothetical protein [Portunus trituberculatus]
MLAEQMVAQTKWLKGTLTLHSDRFREGPDVTGEPRGSPCAHQATAKFKFKSPSVHLVVRGHSTTKSEFHQAELRQVLGLTVQVFLNLCVFRLYDSEIKRGRKFCYFSNYTNYIE